MAMRQPSQQARKGLSRQYRATPVYVPFPEVVSTQVGVQRNGLEGQLERAAQRRLVL